MKSFLVVVIGSCSPSYSTAHRAKPRSHSGIRLVEIRSKQLRLCTVLQRDLYDEPPIVLSLPLCSRCNNVRSSSIKYNKVKKEG